MNNIIGYNKKPECNSFFINDLLLNISCLNRNEDKKKKNNIRKHKPTRPNSAKTCI